MTTSYLSETSMPAWRQHLGGVVHSLRGLSSGALLTGLGVLLGFARELTVASTYGLSPQLDVFVAVMTIQLFFGTQVGNALETAFIARVAKAGGAAAMMRALVPALAGLLLVNCAIVAFLFGSAGLLVNAFFPRFEAGQEALAVRTLGLLTVPIAFASTAGLLRAGLAVLGAFSPGFLAGSVISVCSILCVTLFSERLGIDALTVGVALGNVLVVLMFAVRLIRLTGRDPAWSLAVAGPRDGWFVLWGAAGIVMAGELIYWAVSLTERSLASRLPGGSIAGFFYASTLVSVPLSLLVIPLTTMLFPRMVTAFERDRSAGLALFRQQGLLLLAVSLGVIAVVECSAEAIVELVFLRGRFSPEDARFTASILLVTVWALPFMSLGRLSRNACYALGDYRTPVAGLVLQWMGLAGLGLVLVPLWGATGLAIAIVAGEALTGMVMGGRLAIRLRGAG